jgi:hypothetical protein
MPFPRANSSMLVAAVAAAVPIAGYPSVRNSAPNLNVWLSFTQVVLVLKVGFSV